MQLVHSQPSRQKQLENVMEKFDPCDVLVSVHKVRDLDIASRAIELEMDAARLETSGKETVFVWNLPRNFTTFDSFRCGILSWNTLPGADIVVDVPPSVPEQHRPSCRDWLVKLAEYGAIASRDESACRPFTVHMGDARATESLKLLEASQVPRTLGTLSMHVLVAASSDKLIGA